MTYRPSMRREGDPSPQTEPGLIAESVARHLTRTDLAMEFSHLTVEQIDWLWETFRGTRGKAIGTEIRKAAKDARIMPVAR